MASITLKDIPDELHQTLKAEAAAHGRSLSREIILRLRLSLVEMSRPDAQDTLAQTSAIREKLAARGVNIERRFVNRAKRGGRP